MTGRVFEASGRILAVAEGWHRGPTVPAVADPLEIGPIALDLVKRAPATPAWTARTSTERCRCQEGAWHLLDNS